MAQQSFSVFLFLFVLILASCSDDDSLSAGSSIVNSEETVASLETFLLELNISTKDSVTSEELYIVTESIGNIQTYVNNDFWNAFDYHFNLNRPLDSIFEYGNFQVTKSPITYRLILDYPNSIDELNTVGEVSDFLQGYLIPGDYFIDILALDIDNKNGFAEKINTDISNVVSIEPSQKSAYIGNFTIQIPAQ